MWPEYVSALRRAVLAGRLKLNLPRKCVIG